MAGTLTALYRHFDARGALLYVGISLSPTYRLQQHGRTAHWSDDIARVTIEWFPSRALALEAERAAISREDPRHNLQRPPLPVEPVTSEIPTLRAPVIVDRPEYVAAHFHISYRSVASAIKRGMPRESIRGKVCRYDLAAIGEWFQAEAAVRQAQKVVAKQEADRRTHQRMVDAIEMVGRRRA